MKRVRALSLSGRETRVDLHNASGSVYLKLFIDAGNDETLVLAGTLDEWKTRLLGPLKTAMAAAAADPRTIGLDVAAIERARKRAGDVRE